MAGGSSSRPDTLMQTGSAANLDKSPCRRGGPYVFEAIANADEPTRKRGGIGLLAGGGGQFGRQLRHGDVGLLGDLLQKKRPMRFELGVAASAAGLGGKASPHTKGLHQVDDKGNRHPEMRRGRVARMTFIDKADNALTQIKRVRLRHRESPPFGSESYRLLKILLIQAESPALAIEAASLPSRGGMGTSGQAAFRLGWTSIAGLTWRPLREAAESIASARRCSTSSVARRYTATSPCSSGDIASLIAGSRQLIGDHDSQRSMWEALTAYGGRRQRFGRRSERCLW